ncbi:MAG: hypothetical protein JNJ48_07755, partial [Phycisphaerae bacterium]|nr:hypothetical protein [Phycisphaerae bacterium]
MSGPADGREAARCGAPAWAGAVLAMGALIARATSTASSLPMWDLDPVSEPAVAIGMGPAGSAVVDALVLLGAVLMLAGSPWRAGRGWWVAAGLALAGCVSVVANGWLLPGASAGNVRVGLAWMSGVCCAVALAHAGRDARLRRAVFAAALGLVAVMALKGAAQVFVERAGTLEHFERLRGTMFGDDPSGAAAFERRIGQVEASGWFGLSNVYATFAALAAAAGAALLLGEWRGARRRGVLWASGLGAAMGLGALVMADSKGGYGALAAGLGAAGAAVWLGRRDGGAWGKWRWAGAWTIAGAGAAALGAVAARGMVGERIGELSLWFRWMYMEAASRIGAGAGPWGVGPDGFKSAYLTAKNPLNPEEVASPHSVLFDWWACLGWGGLAWGAALVVMAWWAGRAVVRSASASAAPEEIDARAAARAAMVMLALGVIGSTYLERAAATPEQAAARVLGLALGCVVCWGVAAAGARGAAAALAAAAGVIVAHGQIEMTPVWPASCGVVLAVVGVAAAGRDGAGARPGRAVWAAAFVLAVMTMRVVDRGVTPAMGWELRLAEAAERARPVAEVATRLSAAGAAGADGAERNRLLREASEIAGAALGEAPARDGAELRRAVSRLEARRLTEAADVLLSARPPAPDFATVREASRVLLRAAVAQRALGEEAAAARTAERAVAAVAGVETAQGLTWRAVLLAGWARASGDAAARAGALDADRPPRPEIPKAHDST